MTLKDNFIGILVSGCIGDILGSSNENLSFEEIRKKQIIIDFVQNRYTDDTELTIVLAEYLSKNNQILVGEIHSMYSKIVKSSKRGYSSRTKGILSNWSECTIGGNADTNGSVMRIAPLALFPINKDEDIYKAVKYCVYCTHGESKDAVDTSFLHVKLLKGILFKKLITAESIYTYALDVTKRTQNASLYSLLILIHPNNRWQLFKKGLPTIDDNVTKNIFGFNMFQIKALHAYICALICFFYNFSHPTEALIMAANIGGDTDTIAKLVGDLIGAVYGTTWIPIPWSQPEGLGQLTKLGTILYERYGK
jgi:ADP-ribosylglycohydrolase